MNKINPMVEIIIARPSPMPLMNPTVKNSQRDERMADTIRRMKIGCFIVSLNELQKLVT